MILFRKINIYTGIALRSLFVIAMLSPWSVNAETSLWRISNGSAVLFIGGTIHLLGASDYPLPQEFDQAYKKTDKLVLETDLSALSNPNVQMEMGQRLQYSDGTTLRDVLDPETYAELEQFCRYLAIPVDSFIYLKPPMVAISLMMIELQRLGLAEAGVDHFYLAKAHAEGRQVDALETLETQLSVLEKLGQGRENELIRSTLRDIRELPKIMGTLKSAWQSGDVQVLEEVGIDPMRTEFPDLYRDLLVERNNAWLPKIVEMLATPERELVLVGALHLVGQEGILEQMRKRGYFVERFRHDPLDTQ